MDDWKDCNKPTLGEEVLAKVPVAPEEGFYWAILYGCLVEPVELHDKKVWAAGRDTPLSVDEYQVVSARLTPPVTI